MTTTIYGDQLDPDTGETTGEKIFFEDVCKTVGPSDEDCDYWNPMVALSTIRRFLTKPRPRVSC